MEPVVRGREAGGGEVKFPHTHYPKGKRVFVKLRDGSRVVDKFVQRRQRAVILETCSIATKHIAGMGFAR